MLVTVPGGGGGGACELEIEELDENELATEELEVEVGEEDGDGDGVLDPRLDEVVVVVTTGELLGVEVGNGGGDMDEDILVLEITADEGLVEDTGVEEGATELLLLEEGRAELLRGVSEGRDVDEY